MSGSEKDELPKATPLAAPVENTVIVLSPIVLGITLGIVCGLVLFAATLWLVLKGGTRIGPHLELLNQFFYGYSVTVRGSFVGFVYGFFCGGVGGWIVATVYNTVVAFRRRR